MVPSDVKNWKKPKFEQNLLVWTAISNAGLDQWYFLPKGFLIDQDFYLNYSKIKRLMSLIKRQHKKDKYIFLTDLISSHDAKSIQE